MNRENRDFDDTYWRERNDPAWEDTSIQRYLPALEVALEELPRASRATQSAETASQVAEGREALCIGGVATSVRGAGHSSRLSIQG